MRVRRRDFLRAAGTGVAFALVGLRSKGSGGAGARRATRVLVFNAAGGLRSTAAFHASPKVALNPWGMLASEGSLRLGAVLRADESVVTYDAPSWQGAPEVPPIDEAARHFAVLGAVDHAPDGSRRAGDHGDDGARLTTGYFGRSDVPGLVTVLNRFLGGEAAAPVAVLEDDSGFRYAPPDWIAHKPISLLYYQLPAEPPAGGSLLVGRPLEDRLDARAVVRRRHLARDGIQTFINAKGALRRFGPLLADPRLRVDREPDAELGGITNLMLLEALGDSTASNGDHSLRQVALALRLLQMGSPAVEVSVGGFDNHDLEREVAPQLYTRFGRMLAGVHFVLSRMPDETGAPMLDSTLVVTTSEFGRNSYEDGGFNDGDGSDHGNGPSWRNQAHVVFGAGITPKILHDTDDDNVPLDGVASTHALLATISAAVGVPQSEIDALWPPGSALYPEGGPLWDLWA